MPNWCYNCATLKCPTLDTYKKVVDAIQKNLLFSTFVPLSSHNECDDDNNECDDDNNEGHNDDNNIEGDDWIDLAYKKWGTKWEAQDIELTYLNEETLEIHAFFDSAWSPPLAFYTTLHKNQNIDITAHYHESGMEFFGKFEYTDTSKIDESYSYPSDMEELEELKDVIDDDMWCFMSCEWENLQELWEEEEEEDADQEIQEIENEIQEAPEPQPRQQ